MGNVIMDGEIARDPTRRFVLKSGAAVGGGLLLSFTTAAEGKAAGDTQVNAYVRIAPDGKLTIAIFSATGQRPAFGAPGRASADRGEILGQRAIAAQKAARRDRLVDIEDILGADAADSAISIDRQVDREVLIQLQ